MDNYIKKIISDTLGETNAASDTQKSKDNLSAEQSNKGEIAKSQEKSNIPANPKKDFASDEKSNKGTVASQNKDEVSGAGNISGSGGTGAGKNNSTGAEKSGGNAVRDENVKGVAQSPLICECLVVKPCDKQSLGMAFVPNQVWRDDLFEPETALDLGTIFPCLFKPFHGGGKK